MNRAFDAAKWMGQFVLQCVFFALMAWLMLGMMSYDLRMLMRAGASISSGLLFQHFLLARFVSGLLAGIVAVALLRAIHLVRGGQNQPEPSVSHRPQAWVWAPYTLYLIYGLSQWVSAHTTRSVLTPSATHWTDAFSVFFGAGCTLPDRDFLEFVLNAPDCIQRVTYTAPWIAAIGYSIAAFIPFAWLTRIRGRFDSTADLAQPAQDQSLEAHPQASLQ